MLCANYKFVGPWYTKEERDLKLIQDSVRGAGKKREGGEEGDFFECLREVKLVWSLSADFV